jgi:hypothetical protein
MSEWDDFARAMTGFLRTAPTGANLILMGPRDQLFQITLHDVAIVAWAQADGSGGSWTMPPEDGETLQFRGWRSTQGAWQYVCMVEEDDAAADIARAVVAALIDAMHVASPGDLRVAAHTDDRQDIDVSALRFEQPAPAVYDAPGWYRNPDTDGWIDPRTGAGISMTIRHELTEPYWLEDLDLARRKLAHDYGGIGCLIEAVPVTVGGVRGMAQLFKVPDARWERGRAYAASVFLAKVGVTVNLGCVVTESAPTGMRETLVALHVGDRLEHPGHPYDSGLESLLPYFPSDQEMWDQHYPDHPLSVVRAWVRGLDEVVRLAPEFVALPDYRGYSRG